MTNEGPLAKRTCLSKLRYANKGKASKMALYYSQIYRHKMKVYRCSFCDDYHLTQSGPRTRVRQAPKVKIKVRQPMSIWQRIMNRVKSTLT